jgi:hypothetical protein
VAFAANDSEKLQNHGGSLAQESQELGRWPRELRRPCELVARSDPNENSRRINAVLSLVFFHTQRKSILPQKQKRLRETSP